MLDLEEGAEVHGAGGIANVVVFHVGDDADNFEVAGAFYAGDAEVDADGIFAVGEELFNEGLIDDGDRDRGGGVVFADSAAAKDMVADDVKELRTDAHPGGTDVGVGAGFGAALDVGAFAVVVSFEWRVEGE